MKRFILTAMHPKYRKELIAIAAAMGGVVFMFGAEFRDGLSAMKSRFRDSFVGEVPVAAEIKRLERETGDLIPVVEDKAQRAFELKKTILQQRQFVTSIREKILDAEASDNPSDAASEIARSQQQALSRADETLANYEAEFARMLEDLQVDLWHKIALEAEQRYLASRLNSLESAQEKDELDEEFSRLAKVATALNERLDFDQSLAANEDGDLMSIIKNLNDDGTFVTRPAVDRSYSPTAESKTP